MTLLIEHRLRRMEPYEAASFWIARRARGALSDDERALFSRWLENPAAADAYGRMDRLWAELSLMKPRRARSAAGDPLMNANFDKALDLSAVSLSALCLVHCLALPALSLFLPVLGLWARAEWVHVLFVALAAPIAVLAFVDRKAWRPYSWPLLGLALVGLALMLAGATDVFSAVDERVTTVSGGTLLALAHLGNLRRRHQMARRDSCGH